MLAVVPPTLASSPATRPHHVIEARYATRRSAVVCYLRSRFPRVGEAQLDDAVSEAFVDLLRQRADVQAAWEQGGPDRVERLLRVVAWRKLRGERRRASSRCELAVEDLSTLRRSSPAGQTLGAAMMHLDRSIDRAVPEANTRPSQLPAVRAALLDKLETHDSDGTVAARHGIRREHLNRAKRALMQEFTQLV